MIGHAIARFQSRVRLSNADVVAIRRVRRRQQMQDASAARDLRASLGCEGIACTKRPTETAPDGSRLCGDCLREWYQGLVACATLQAARQRDSWRAA